MTDRPVPALGPAEERVLRLRAQGLLYKEIAQLLNRSEQTIKNEMTSIYRKLNVSNTMEAARVLGWVKVPGEPILPEVVYVSCEFVGTCGRRLGHRGHHGGFRPLSPAPETDTGGGS